MTERSPYDPKNLIRGGQSAIHYVRMSRDVFVWTARGSFLAWVLYIAYRVSGWTTRYDWYFFYKFLLSDSVIAITKNGDRPFDYYDESWRKVTVPVSEFINDPLVIGHGAAMWEIIFAWSLQGLVPAALMAFLLFGLFHFVGIGLSRADRVRGSMLVGAQDLQRIIEAKWRDWRKARGKTKEDEYRYSIGGVDFPPDAPMVHTQMIGTPGSGKTVAMMELLDQIRANGDQAVIYDRMGAFIRRFYDEETDYILNPFDARDAGWSPFADADSGPGFAAMAEAMIPPPKNVSDPFWSSAARSVFRSLAETLSNSKRANVEELSRIILKSDLETLADEVKNTPGGAMVDLKSEKTAQSVRTSIVEPLEFLMYLKHRERAFSIGDWVRSGDPGVLFLSGQVQHAAATRNLISAAIEIAANATMTCGPSDRPRIWFFIDELPSLNYLPCLDRSLAEIRQFGGCFVLGYQVFAKLRDVYGDRVAEAISGTVNNSFIFTTPDEPTAKRCSMALGMEDITEKAEGVSIGANETRDGVTFQHKRIERPIATASEIMDLPPLACFARFAYDTPRTMLELDYVARGEAALAFVPPTEENQEKEASRRQRDDEAWSAREAADAIKDGDVIEDAEVVEESIGVSGHAPAEQRAPTQTGETLDIASLPIPARSTAPDPHKRVRGEERFLKEAAAWLARLRGPISPRTGEPERAFTETHEQCLVDHFIVQRLRGIAASEIGEMDQTLAPMGGEACEKAARRSAENGALLAGFLKREERREEARCRKEAEEARAPLEESDVQPMRRSNTDAALTARPSGGSTQGELLLEERPKCAAQDNARPDPVRAAAPVPGDVEAAQHEPEPKSYQSRIS